MVVTFNPNTINNQTGKRHFSCVSMATNGDFHMTLVQMLIAMIKKKKKKKLFALIFLGLLTNFFFFFASEQKREFFIYVYIKFWAQGFNWG